MRPYIDFNTQKRTISNNEGDKKFSIRQNYEKFKKENKNKSCKK